MAVQTAAFSFAKTTSAAPAVQVIPSVGFLAKGAMAFTTGQTVLESWQNGYLWAVGFTSGASDSFSHACGSENGVSPTNSSERVAAKFLTIVDAAGTTLAECDLTSFNSDGTITVTWTTNDANAYQINGWALGGSDITNVKAVNFLSVAATIGIQATTGVGFKADVLIASFSPNTSIPSTLANTSPNLGVSVRNAGGGWAFGEELFDNVTTDQSRYVAMPGTGIGAALALSGVARAQAFITSWTADGWSMDYFANNSGTAKEIVGLAIQGGTWQAGYETRPVGTAPQSLTLSGMSITPRGLLVCANPGVWGVPGITPGKLMFGVSDGTHSYAIGVIDRYNAGASIALGLQRSGYVLSISSSNTGALDYEAATPTFANPTVLTFDPSAAGGSASAIGWLAVGDGRPGIPKSRVFTGA